MPPPPPPPPGPPPPPAAPAPPPVGKGGKASDRGALLNQIHKGTKLKKAVTNDKSAPVLVPPKSTPAMGGGGDGGGGGAGKFNTVAVRNLGGVHGSMPAFATAEAPATGGLGGLFPVGVPKLPSQARIQPRTGSPKVPPKSTPAMGGGGDGGGGGAGKFNTVAVRNLGGVHGSMPAFATAEAPATGGLGGLFPVGVPKLPSQIRSQPSTGDPKGPIADAFRSPGLQKKFQNKSSSAPDGLLNEATSRHNIVLPVPPPSIDKPIHVHSEADLNAAHSLADNSSSGSSKNVHAMSGHPIGSPCLPRSQPQLPQTQAPHNGISNGALNFNRLLPTAETPPSSRPLPVLPIIHFKQSSVTVPPPTTSTKPVSDRPPSPPSCANKYLYSPKANHSESRFPPLPTSIIPPPPPSIRPPARQINRELPQRPVNVSVGRPGPPPPQRTIAVVRPTTPPKRVHEMNPLERMSDEIIADDNDFNKRFIFHDTCDFPSPAPLIKSTKIYPSQHNKTATVLRGTSSPPPLTY